jgi:ParB family chromosome partitioning protein
LGRGLEALLGPQVQSKEASESSPRAAPAGDHLLKIPLDLLGRGRFQPRVDMRPESLQELADSIRAQGVIQPIIVRPVGTPGAGESQRYEIIAGERRWRAAQIAGIAEIPAVVRHVPDESAVAMALIENIEEARALQRLIGEFAFTQQEAADAVGRSRVTVANLLRLLELDDEVKGLLERREIEMGHARALLGLTQRRQQIEVAKVVAGKGLSVRETEALVRRILNPKKRDEGSESRDPDVRRLEDQLSDKLGARVTIRHSSASGKGRLTVNYNSLDELDGILEHIQ